MRLTNWKSHRRAALVFTKFNLLENNQGFGKIFYVMYHYVHLARFTRNLFAPETIKISTYEKNLLNNDSLRLIYFENISIALAYKWKNERLRKLYVKYGVLLEFHSFRVYLRTYRYLMCFCSTLSYTCVQRNEVVLKLPNFERPN